MLGALQGAQLWVVFSSSFLIALCILGALHGAQKRSSNLLGRLAGRRLDGPAEAPGAGGLPPHRHVGSDGGQRRAPGGPKAPIGTERNNTYFYNLYIGKFG